MDKQLNRDTQLKLETVEQAELTGVNGGLNVDALRSTLLGLPSGEWNYQSPFSKYVIGRNLPVAE